MNEFDETFGRILFGMEDDRQDDMISIHHTGSLDKLNEVNRPLVQIYKMEKGKERPFPFSRLEDERKE